MIYTNQKSYFKLKINLTFQSAICIISQYFDKIILQVLKNDYGKVSQHWLSWKMTSNTDLQSWPEVPSIAHFCSLFRLVYWYFSFICSEKEPLLQTSSDKIFSPHNQPGATVCNKMLPSTLLGCSSDTGDCCQLRLCSATLRLAPAQSQLTYLHSTITLSQHTPIAICLLHPP